MEEEEEEFGAGLDSLMKASHQKTIDLDEFMSSNTNSANTQAMEEEEEEFGAGLDSLMKVSHQKTIDLDEFMSANTFSNAHNAADVDLKEEEEEEENDDETDSSSEAAESLGSE
eukprot:925891_1